MKRKTEKQESVEKELEGKNKKQGEEISELVGKLFAEEQKNLKLSQQGVLDKNRIRDNDQELKDLWAKIKDNYETIDQKDSELRKIAELHAKSSNAFEKC